MQFTVMVDAVTDIDENITGEVKIYPNPFTSNSTVAYTLIRESNVQLVVYDALGKMITSLVNDKQQAGNQLVNFDGTSHLAGLYYFRLLIIIMERL